MEVFYTSDCKFAFRLGSTKTKGWLKSHRLKKVDQDKVDGCA